MLPWLLAQLGSVARAGYGRVGVRATNYMSIGVIREHKLKGKAHYS